MSLIVKFVVIFLLLYASDASVQEDEEMYQFYLISGDIIMLVPGPFGMEFMKTKHGASCHGLVIFPKVTVTTCSCALTIGGKLGTNKFETINADHIWFQIYEPTGFGSEKNSKRYNYKSLLTHSKCQEQKNFYIYDIAIGIMDKGINALSLYKQHFKPTQPNQVNSCQVYHKYNPGYTNYLIGTNITVKPFFNCTFSQNVDNTKIDKSSHYCVTDSNCKYDVGTALKCGNDLIALMSSQRCSKNQNVIAVKLTLAYELSNLLTPGQKGYRSKGTKHTYTLFMVFFSLFKLKVC